MFNELVCKKKERIMSSSGPYLFIDISIYSFLNSNNNLYRRRLSVCTSLLYVYDLGHETK